MSFIQTVNEETNVQRTAAKKISIKGMALIETGNMYLGAILCDLATEICAAADRIDAAAHEELNATYKRAQENSATILEAALAGAELEKRRADKK